MSVINQSATIDRLTILGAGVWGCALASTIQRGGQLEPLMWSRQSGLDLAAAVADTPIVVSAVSMAGVPEVVARLAGKLQQGQIIVTATKGLDGATNLTPAQIWADAFPQNSIVVLSGPNLSQEIQAGLPAATAIASRDRSAMELVQSVFNSSKFRVYTNDDPIGVEIAGTIKNVMAIAAGTCDGLDLGNNAKAALLTRGLAEIVRIGTGWGAKPETFYGLSGLGDLLATCNSPLSRNYQVGFRLAGGELLPDILASLKGTAEGVNTTKVLIQIATRDNIYMPITAAVDRLLRQEITPQAAASSLMSGDRKAER
jgi:glycerol-3-phosphate dehydrogenase (NAD(P)+)